MVPYRRPISPIFIRPDTSLTTYSFNVSNLAQLWFLRDGPLGAEIRSDRIGTVERLAAPRRRGISIERMMKIGQPSHGPARQIAKDLLPHDGPP